MENADGMPIQLMHPVKPLVTSTSLSSQNPEDITADMLQMKINQFKGFELNLEEKDITIVKEIGAGNFGKVFLSRITIKNKKYLAAVKRPNLLDDNTRRDFMQEAAILTQLSNQYVVSIVAVVDGLELNIVQEFMHLGSLDKYLEDNKHPEDNKPKVTLKNMNLWAFQIASGKIVQIFITIYSLKF